MSKAEFWQRGEALDYINSTDATIPNNTSSSGKTPPPSPLSFWRRAARWTP